MKGIIMVARIFQSTVIVLLCAFSSLAHAYVGPGAGLSAIGSVLVFIGACLLVLVGFVWYPVKRLLKKNKAPASEKESAPEGQAATAELAEEKES
jgi:protein-S-isoprenylcysteine O-methyltransferase Ste14